MNCKLDCTQSHTLRKWGDLLSGELQIGEDAASTFMVSQEESEQHRQQQHQLSVEQLFSYSVSHSHFSQLHLDCLSRNLWFEMSGMGKRRHDYTFSFSFFLVLLFLQIEDTLCKTYSSDWWLWRISTSFPSLASSQVVPAMGSQWLLGS